MKTLTVTEARRNLSRWLQAAARGEEVAIVSGPDIIALRKVEVQATDYPWQEYGVTASEVAQYEAAAVSEHQRQKKAGKLKYLSAADLCEQREEAVRD